MGNVSYSRQEDLAKGRDFAGASGSVQDGNVGRVYDGDLFAENVPAQQRVLHLVVW